MKKDKKHNQLENNDLSKNGKVETEPNNLEQASQIKYGEPLNKSEALPEFTVDIWMRYEERKRYVEGGDMLSFCFNMGTNEEWFCNIPIERLLTVLMKHKSEYMKDFDDIRQIRYASMDSDQSESVL